MANFERMSFERAIEYKNAEIIFHLENESGNRKKPFWKRFFHGFCKILYQRTHLTKSFHCDWRLYIIRFVCISKRSQLFIITLSSWQQQKNNFIQFFGTTDMWSVSVYINTATVDIKVNRNFFFWIYHNESVRQNTNNIIFYFGVILEARTLRLPSLKCIQCQAACDITNVVVSRSTTTTTTTMARWCW